MISDEKLAAYAQGRLDPDEAEEIAAAVQLDAALAARLAGLQARAPGRFDAGSAWTRVQETLIRLGNGAATLAASAPGYVRWSLLAACLALGVIVGRMSAPAPLLHAEAGVLRPGAALADVLDHRLTQAPENRRARLRVGQSFHSLEGGYCRTFVSGGRGEISGLACRRAGPWTIRIAAAGFPPQGDFAEGRLEAPAVLDMVDALIVGEALDEEQERAARGQRWR